MNAGSWLLLVILAVALVVALAWFLTRVFPQLSTAEQDKVRGVFRAFPLLLAFAASFAVVLWLNPIKAELIVYSVSKMAVFGWMGYWVDRLAFRPEDRPHLQEGIGRGTAWKRRSLIVAAAILAGGMTP